MRNTILLTLVLLPMAACGDTGADQQPPQPAAAQTAMAAVSAQELPSVLVYKTPTCGCCNGWIDHLRDAGFEVEAVDANIQEVMAVKMDAGVPTSMSSCHTALVDGYVVEGHVPATQVKRLLAERPEIAGIAVPGMPVGSPGMEGPNPQPYQVLSFSHEGEAGVFADVDPR